MVLKCAVYDAFHKCISINIRENRIECMIGIIVMLSI